ncbi:MAG: hypothetical protein AAF656_08600 [Planctomycetota bacterium]
MPKSALQTSTRVAVRNAVLWGLMLSVLVVGGLARGGQTDEPLDISVRGADLTLRLPSGFDAKAGRTDGGEIIVAQRELMELRATVQGDVTMQEALRSVYGGSQLEVTSALVAGRPGAIATYVQPGPSLSFTYVAVANTADGRLILIDLTALGEMDRHDHRLLRTIAAAAELNDAN